MDPKAVFEALQSKFGDAVYELHADEKKDLDPWFFVKADKAVEVCGHLRDAPELAFNYMECLSGVDWPDKNELHVVVHAFSYSHKHRVVLKFALHRDTPVMHTLSVVWSAANWQERECFDLLGVHFEGHPDLRRIMLPEDWVGYPLRKDYKEKPEYHGIPTTRPNPLELLKIKPPAAPAAEKKPEAAEKKDKPAEKKPDTEKAEA
jgi:NADH-quinone oxidoreductase subunit C